MVRYVVSVPTVESGNDAGVHLENYAVSQSGEDLVYVTMQYGPGDRYVDGNGASIIVGVPAFEVRPVIPGPMFGPSALVSAGDIRLMDEEEKTRFANAGMLPLEALRNRPLPGPPAVPAHERSWREPQPLTGVNPYIRKLGL